MSVRIIEFKGKKILFSDFSNIKDQRIMFEVLQEMNDLLKETHIDIGTK